MKRKEVDCFVTGGSGFFGGILLKALLGRGLSCVSLDVIPCSISHSNLETIQGSILDEDLLLQVSTRFEFRTIYHCAALLAHEERNKDLLWKVNVVGSVNVAEMAVRSSASHLVFVSSNCIFGRELQGLIDELEKPCPVETYGLSKLEAEKSLLSFSNRLKVQIIRPPTIIDEGRLGLLAILFEFIEEDRTVWLVGEGRNRYQFVYAKDLAEACILSSANEGSGIFNVGASDVQSLRETFQFIISKSGSFSKLRSFPRRPALIAMKILHRMNLSPLGPYHTNMIACDFMFDTTRIASHLNWTPTLSNSEMLYLAFQYYRENRANIRSNISGSAHLRPAKMGIIRFLKWLS